MRLAVLQELCLLIAAMRDARKGDPSVARVKSPLASKRRNKAATPPAPAPTTPTPAH